MDSGTSSDGGSSRGATPRFVGAPCALSCGTMSKQGPRAVAVGEAIVEFVRGGDGRFGLSAAPATPSTTAVYLARAGIDDRVCDGARRRPLFRTRSSRWRRRKAFPASWCCACAAGCRACRWSTLDAAGARQRATTGSGEAPARELFELPAWGRVAEGMTKARLVYFSGITLSLYSNVGTRPLSGDSSRLARQQGVKVAFDGNFRPRGWKGDLAAHAHGVHGGAQARRHRAAGL